MLALLYVGRGVLGPVALATTLAFALAPVVRQIRRFGVGQKPAALATLLLGGLVVAAVASGVVAQLGEMSRELPSYQSNLRAKLATLRQLAVGQLQEVQGQGGGATGSLALPETEGANSSAEDDRHHGAPRAEDALRQLLAMMWGPAGAVGIVVIVLVFTLLEQDALRDRFIRLIGGHDIRVATSAVNDAGRRLSRYLLSQLLVNAGVAMLMGALLTWLGLMHAAVWAVLAGVLRFIPYVGFPAAGLCAIAMAAALSPGWDLVGPTALAFLGVHGLVAYGIEPRLYGHATGLSPIAVVVAAIFWSALWGPMGLLLSTPLTLFLVVAGRHFATLAFLDVMLGTTPALTLAQRFYQRSLSADAAEILADARAFLKRGTLAGYFDHVVLPAFQLGRLDFDRNLITQPQRQAAQHVVLEVLEALTGMPRPWRTAGAGERMSVFAGRFGLHMRQDRLGRESRKGQERAPAGSVLLCLSMNDKEAELAAELLVRLLRAEHFDARHLTVHEWATAPADPGDDAIGTVIVVGPLSGRAADADPLTLDAALLRLPLARRVSMRAAHGVLASSPDGGHFHQMHHTANSFAEVIDLLRNPLA